jgi:hypothetical protein
LSPAVAKFFSVFLFSSADLHFYQSHENEQYNPNLNPCQEKIAFKSGRHSIQPASPARLKQESTPVRTEIRVNIAAANPVVEISFMRRLLLSFIVRGHPHLASALYACCGQTSAAAL